MPHAIRINAPGGPEVLRWEEVAVGEPGPGEARIRHTAIGVNFVDTYQRSGLYPMQLPAVAGKYPRLAGSGARTEPDAGETSPTIVRRRVVLPAPLPPTTATT